MKFGKLPSIGQVDFTLPPDPPENAALLPGKPADNPQLFIGGTAWGNRAWVGKIYPKGSKTTEYLHHYARQFNTIELNTTHYRTPDSLTVGKWQEQVPADFRFCPKVLQRISHSRDLSPPGPLGLARHFCEAIAGLGQNLGPCFIQLPPYFAAEQLPVLAVFLEKWNRWGLPLAVEVRHESWFADPLVFNDLAEVLQTHATSTVITDVAGRRDVCHLRLTTPTVLVRFVGNDLHPTDFTRIDAWAGCLRRWFDSGLENAYFFVHEQDDALVPDLAIYLWEKMKRVPNLAVRGPRLAEKEDGGPQLSLF